MTKAEPESGARRPRRAGRGRAAVPWVCTCVLLVGILGDRWLLRQPSADAAPYHARVQQEAARIPLHFKDWLGSDVPVPPAAVQMLKPNVILSATDVDVMKTYVKHGMGVAIVAALAYDSKEDRALRAVDARHLFEANKIYVGIRKHTYLRGYVFRFIRLFSPRLSRDMVERAVFERVP